MTKFDDDYFKNAEDWLNSIHDENDDKKGIFEKAKEALDDLNIEEDKEVKVLTLSKMICKDTKIVTIKVRFM